MCTQNFLEGSQLFRFYTHDFVLFVNSNGTRIISYQIMVGKKIIEKLFFIYFLGGTKRVTLGYGKVKKFK